MYEIKKIGTLSFSKPCMIMGLILGIITGVFLAIFSNLLIIDLPMLKNLDKTLWILTFTLFPIIGIITGFITGIIIALIYNISAKVLGGIKIDLEAE